MKQCRHCRKRLLDSDLFCPRCGEEYREDLYRYEDRSTARKEYIQKHILGEKIKKLEQRNYHELDHRETNEQTPPVNKKTQLMVGLGLLLLVVFLLIPRFLPLVALIVIFQLAKEVPRKRN